MSSETDRTKTRRGKRPHRRGRSKLTPEQQERRRQRGILYRKNLEKLKEFLAGEDVVEPVVAARSMIGITFPPVPQYTDRVVRAFYDKTSEPKNLCKEGFDPKAEWDAFIASYAHRFAAPVVTKGKPPNKSRKGIGGPKDKKVTQAVKKVVLDAKVAGEQIDFEIILDRVWSSVFPKLDKNRYPSKLTVLRGKVRESVRRNFPQYAANKSKSKNPSRKRRD